MFRGVVGGGQAGKDAGDRRRVHDVALSLGHQIGQEGADAVDHPPQIHAHHPLPRRQWSEPCVGLRRHPRVVADHVDPVEPLDGGDCQGLDRGLDTHVRGDDQGLHPVGTDHVGGTGQPVLVHVGQDHVHAGRGEALGEGQPDPTRRAGHHRDLSCAELHASSRGPPPGTLPGTADPTSVDRASLG